MAHSRQSVVRRRGRRRRRRRDRRSLSLPVLGRPPSILAKGPGEAPPRGSPAHEGRGANALDLPRGPDPPHEALEVLLPSHHGRVPPDLTPQSQGVPEDLADEGGLAPGALDLVPQAPVPRLVQLPLLVRVEEGRVAHAKVVGRVGIHDAGEVLGLGAPTAVPDLDQIAEPGIRPEVSRGPLEGVLAALRRQEGPTEGRGPEEGVNQGPPGSDVDAPNAAAGLRRRRRGDGEEVPEPREVGETVRHGGDETPGGALPPHAVVVLEDALGDLLDGVLSREVDGPVVPPPAPPRHEVRREARARLGQPPKVPSGRRGVVVVLHRLWGEALARRASELQESERAA